MIGQTLNSRYKIISRLGEGGMGEVFQATDSQTGQQVAVKVLARQLTAHPESLERFRREGETLRQLDHPNIVKFVDAFEHEGQYVIVMEHVSGGNLHDLIKQGALPVERARQIGLDLCDALIRSHRLNIIHRDIKPENVLIDQHGTPKLADFGVARLSESTRMTRSGTQVGTPYYMAPEAWEGKTLDAQADIWSLGVLLFEMLAGQVPFGGDTGPTVMNKVFTTPPPDLRKLRVETPPGLVKTVNRMITRDKKRRYQSIREASVDLEREGQPAGTPRPVKASRGGQESFFFRYKFLLLAGVVLVGFVVVALFALNQFLSKEEPQPTNTIVAPIIVPSVLTEPTTSTTTGQFSGTIKIASQSPLSGDQSFLGVGIKQGAELALEQLGGELIAMGFDLQFVPYDDQATPDVGVANAKNIVADTAILCGVGHLNSGVMIPSSEEYHTAGLPFVSPANTNPVVTTRGYLEVNRVVGRDDGQAPAIENYAFEALGAASVYIVHNNSSYGQGLAEAFRAAAEEDGITVVGFEETEETSGFIAIISSLLAADPDVVFFAGFYDQAGPFFKTARDAGYQGAFLGTDAMDASTLADLAGNALITGGGMYYSTVGVPPSNYGADGFIADYKAKFGIEPEPYAAEAYDAMGVCLTAIKAAAEIAGGVPTRNAVANMIRGMTYGGLTGTIQFDEIGDLPVGRYYIIKVTAASGEEWYRNEIVEVIDLPSPGR